MHLQLFVQKFSINTLIKKFLKLEEFLKFDKCVSLLRKSKIDYFAKLKEKNVPNCTSCAQVHEWPQSQCGDNRMGIFKLYTTREFF